MKVLKSQIGVPVNVKVEGLPVLRNVVLHRDPFGELFTVHTGKRGRPRLVSPDEILNIDVRKDGKSASSKPVKKQSAKVVANSKGNTKKKTVVVQKPSKKKVVVVKKHKK